MTPSTPKKILKNGHALLKIFFDIFSECVAFFEKIVRWKKNKNLISHKKGYIHFRRPMPASFQKGLGPQKRSFAFFS